jgi:DNA repair exonuclease SbcCD nuclease subunit
MSKVLLFSDLHCHKHKGREDRLRDCLRVLEWVFQKAIEHKISDVIFGGDLLHTRQHIDPEANHHTFEILEKYCSERINFWLLLGNHDMFFRDKGSVSSVVTYRGLKGVTFIDKPCTLEIAGHKVDFLPYTHDEPLIHLEQLQKESKKRKGRKTLVAHMAIDGAQLNTCNTRSYVSIEHDGEMVKVNVDRFGGWDKVWLGHYHKEQKIGHVEYIGSPLQLDFGEALQTKHIIVYDLTDGSTKYITNDFSPQHLEITKDDRDELDNFEIKDNFVGYDTNGLSSIEVIELRKKIEEKSPRHAESFMTIDKDDKTTEHLLDAKAILQDDDKMVEEWVAKHDIGNLDKAYHIAWGKRICKEAAEKFLG